MPTRRTELQLQSNKSDLLELLLSTRDSPRMSSFAADETISQVSAMPLERHGESNAKVNYEGIIGQERQEKAAATPCLTSGPQVQADQRILIASVI